MSAFRVKPTPELLERIVANYRQTGDVVNAAIRSGISRAAFYRWKARGEKAKSGPLRDFVDTLTRAREDDIALDVVRHKQLAHGGVFKLPVHEKDGRAVKDADGNLVFEDVVLLPNRQALETRLRWKAADRYPGSAGRIPPPQEELPPPEHARPRDLEDMFMSVARRMAAMGDEFKPAIETTAKLVKPEPEMGG